MKGLYGIIKGALTFQVWMEKILKDLEYSKLNYDIARGVYLKTIQDDVVRILRHSDDLVILSIIIFPQLFQNVLHFAVAKNILPKFHTDKSCATKH